MRCVGLLNLAKGLGEVLDVPHLYLVFCSKVTVSDLKICSVGFFGMCYTAYCKKGVIKAFYHP